MFGISLGELLLIIIIAVLVLEPQDLPKIATNFARLVNYLRSLIDELKSELVSHDNIVKTFKPNPRNTLKHYDFTLVDKPTGAYQPELEFEDQSNPQDPSIKLKQNNLQN